ncbi:MAG: hypothetical protein AB7Y46_09030 [Armatimonadota bacterium]
MRRVGTGLLMAVLSCSLVAAAGPTVELSVDPAEGTVGDRFTAEVTVKAPPGITLVLPDEDAEQGEAEELGLEVAEERLGDGSRRVVQRYRLTLWEVGERTVQAPSIPWRAGDGEARSAPRPRTTVTIRSVLPEGAEDIQEIRGPREIPLRWHHYALAALPALVLAGLVIGALVWLRRRRAGEPAEAIVPPLPPHEEALRALDELAAEDLPGRGEVKAHYVRLSWIMRNYLERRWRLPALEETTGMLAHTMVGSGLVSQEVASALLGVLRRADLAKFAKHRPQPDLARADIDEARRVIHLSRPAPPEPEAEA